MIEIIKLHSILSQQAPSINRSEQSLPDKTRCISTTAYCQIINTLSPIHYTNFLTHLLTTLLQSKNQHHINILGSVGLPSGGGGAVGFCLYSYMLHFH